MKTMRQVFGETLAEEGEIRQNLRVLDADVSGSTQTAIFRHRFPERFYNFGIAEANMAAAAAGMATCGLIPVVSTFAFLLAVRAMDPIHSLIAYNALNVKLAGGYSGLSDHADGASHQSVCDMAMMRALPGMVVLAPSDEETTRQAVRAMLDYKGPAYVRLSRADVGSLHGGAERVEIGRAFELIKGRDVCIVTTGTMLEAVLNAREILKPQGIDAGILEAISVKPLDEAAVRKAAEEYGTLVTVEEHNVIGGLGDAVCAAVSSCDNARVYKIGLYDSFGQSSRDYSTLLAAYGLDGASLAKLIKGLIWNIL